MTIELALAVSVISVIFAVYFGLAGLRRNKTKDDKENAADMTRLEVKLDSISSGIAELKEDFKHQRNELREMRERLVRVEQSTKSAHKRLDNIGAGRASGE